MARAGQSRMAPGKMALIALLFALLLVRTDGANWAQLNGYQRQSMASAGEMPFGRRWGFSVAVIERPARPNVVVPEYEKSKIYVMGGEDFHVNTTVQAFLASQRSVGGNFRYQEEPPDFSQQKSAEAQIDGSTELNGYFYDPRWPALGGGGYKNDVYRTSGLAWKLVPDNRYHMLRDEPLPRIASNAYWEQMGSPIVPPKGTDYREWLCCLAEMNVPCLNTTVCNIPDLLPTALNRRWSPRRGHRSVTVLTDAGDRIILMGGRAREFAPLHYKYRIGGLVDPKAVSSLVPKLKLIQGVAITPTPKPVPSVEEAALMHDRAILVNDIWMSDDGEAWYLVNGGCWNGVTQQDHAYLPGTQVQQCRTTTDCYNNRLGNAECVEGMCVCRHWSPRERFAATVSGRSIYVSGGVTFVQRHRCGYFSCDTETAKLVNDVWRSDDAGARWIHLVASAPWEPRADFAMVYMESSNMLWVFGGRAGIAADLEGVDMDNDGYPDEDEPSLIEDGELDPQNEVPQLYLDTLQLVTDSPNRLLGDAWYAQMPGEFDQWTLNETVNPWTARAGHAVIVDGSRFLLMGGQTLQEEADSLPDFPGPAEQVDWAALHLVSNVYRRKALEEPPVYSGQRMLGLMMLPNDEVWIVETSGGILGGELRNGGSGGGGNNGPSPSPKASPSPVAKLNLGGSVNVVQYPTRNYSIPANMRPNLWYQDYEIPRTQAEGYFDPTVRITKYGFPERLLKGMSDNFNKTNVDDLANLSQEQVARFKNVFDLRVPDICDHVQKARALIQKCQLKYKGHDSEYMRTLLIVDNSNFEILSSAEAPEDTNPSGESCHNEGTVPHYTQLDYLCRSRFPAKAFFGAVMMEQTVYVLGGMEGRNNYAGDVWYRDERSPSAVIVAMPRTETSDYMFTFACDEPGCSYEYRAWDVEVEDKPVMLADWTPAFSTFNAFLINENRRKTRLEIRAIDPAGNRESLIEQGRNVYEWVYIPPFPMLEVLGGTLTALFSLLTALFLWLRYKRLQALKRYLEKRNNRKLKNKMGQTLREYEADLAEQFLKKGAEVADKKAAEEEDARRAALLGEATVPRFKFSNQLAQQTVAGAAAKKKEAAERAQQEAAEKAAKEREKQEKEQKERQAGKGIQAPKGAPPAGPRKPQDAAGYLIPGEPVMVNVTTGRPLLEAFATRGRGRGRGRGGAARGGGAAGAGGKDPASQEIKEDDEMAGADAPQALESAPDPIIRLADNTIVAASQLRYQGKVAATTGPVRLSAVQQLRAEIDKFAAEKAAKEEKERRAAKKQQLLQESQRLLEDESPRRSSKDRTLGAQSVRSIGGGPPSGPQSVRAPAGAPPSAPGGPPQQAPAPGALPFLPPAKRGLTLPPLPNNAAVAGIGAGAPQQQQQPQPASPVALAGRLASTGGFGTGAAGATRPPPGPQPPQGGGDALDMAMRSPPRPGPPSNTLGALSPGGGGGIGFAGPRRGSGSREPSSGPSSGPTSGPSSMGPSPARGPGGDFRRGSGGLSAAGRSALSPSSGSGSSPSPSPARR